MRTADPTLLLEIIRQSQEISSEARWLEHYTHNRDGECVEDCVNQIENSLNAIKEILEKIKDGG